MGISHPIPSKRIRKRMRCWFASLTARLMNSHVKDKQINLQRYHIGRHSCHSCHAVLSIIHPTSVVPAVVIPYNRCLIQFKHLAENRDPFFSDIRVHINDSLAFSVDVNSASGIIIIWLATLYWLDIRPEQPVIVGIARLCHACRRSLPEWKCEQFSSDNPKHAPVHIITLRSSTASVLFRQIPQTARPP